MAKTIKRDDELSGRARIRDKLIEIFADVEKGFTDQRERSDDLMDYWDLYNCKLGERQYYTGNSSIFVPIVRNAIEARRTRFVNQMFPQSGRYVDVTTENGDIPHATMALLEYYVRQARLRTQVVPALVVCGDIEGQYSVYCGWKTMKRHTARKETKPVQIGDLGEFPSLGEVETMEEEETETGGPTVEVLSDADLLILPVTVDSLEEAIDVGGSVTIQRRWTKAKIRQMIEEGEFDEEAGEAAILAMTKKDSPQRIDTRKELADAAGIKTGQGGKYMLGYETWTKLKVAGQMRLCRAYYGGQDTILGCKLNPYWCDKVPVISDPVKKAPGVFKGRAPVADVIDLQILANDYMNEAADTAHYSAMPIVMTDPEKNPRYGTMVLGLAAVWATSPNDTKFAQFPELWKDAFERINAIKAQVFETLSVNPSMVAQSTTSKKQNQAEIANAQQVDILTTADAVTNIEEMILTPLLQRFAEYDHQFREDTLVIRAFGEMGLRAQMEEIPPLQINRRFEFRWFGVEASRNAAQTQQQIAGLNVLKGIPPQLYEGYKLDLKAVLNQIVENVYGPRIAPLLFQDMKKQLSMDPEVENRMLEERFEVMVHPMDDDAKHLQAHMPLMQGGDPSGNIRVHIMGHQQQMQMKAMAQQQQAMGQPGSPGAAGKPGAAGAPKPGAIQQGPRLLKGPGGMINEDRMPSAGAVVMPRKY